jgi:hypothetical protein
VIHFSNLTGTAFMIGNRHCSSLAIRASSRYPSLSTSSLLKGVWNSAEGRQKMKYTKYVTKSTNVIFLVIDMLLALLR